MHHSGVIPASTYRLLCIFFFPQSIFFLFGTPPTIDLPYHENKASKIIITVEIYIDFSFLKRYPNGDFNVGVTPLSTLTIINVISSTDKKR